jgi:hypothetical protein
MEIEDIMRDLLTLFRERQLGVPVRFRVDFADGRTIDLPFDLVRTITTTGPGRPSASLPADRGPTTIREAIRLALLLQDNRLTSGQLQLEVQRRWPDRGWMDESIGIEAARMVRDGQLVNHKAKDAPDDGRGPGYGITEWEPPDATNSRG